MMNIFWPAILVGVVANMVIGFLWYGPIFGKAWAREAGIDMNQRPATNEMIKAMLLMLIGCFLMAYTLAHNVEAWRSLMASVIASGKAPGMDMEKVPLMLTLNSAFWTTIGYIVPIYLSQVAWEKRSWKMFGINVGYYLVSLLVLSGLLSYWVKTA